MVMLLLVFIFLFRNEGRYLDIIANYSSIIILLIGLGLIFYWFANGLFRYLNKEIRSVFRFWLLMVIWFIIVPILFFGVGINTELFYQGMYHDYRYLIFSLLPFMFLSDKAQTYFVRIYTSVSILAVMCGIVAIIIVDKSFSNIAERSSVFSLPYYLWWVVMMVYPYMYLRTTFTSKDRLGIVLLGLHLLLSLIFLKRAGVVNAILFISLASIFSSESKKRNKVILVFTVIFFSFSFFLGSYFDLLFERFSQDSSNLNEWDRNIEVLEFFNNITDEQLITGFGMNNYLKMTYIGELDKGVNSLHIGFFNLLYKGGYLYVAFIIFLAYNIFKLYKYIQIDPEIKIGFILGIVFLISFSYENGWSYLPSNFFSLLPIYRAIYLRRRLIDNARLVLIRKRSQNVLGRPSGDNKK